MSFMKFQIEIGVEVLSFKASSIFRSDTAMFRFWESPPRIFKPVRYKSKWFENWAEFHQVSPLIVNIDLITIYLSLV